MKKTHKVVMLPTEKASIIELNLNNNKLFDSRDVSANKAEPQHLYIISDDEIKEGDWYILIPEDKVVHCKVSFDHKGHRDYKKIVATTDESIGYTDHRISPVPNFCDYPQLPESFIQAFIKAYNEGKPITEVDLEMGCIGKNSMYGYEIIKTRPDNTVIVHQSKIYSRDEVQVLCEKAFLAGMVYYEGSSSSHTPDKNTWIQDNL